MIAQDAPELVYVGDPLCSWCWGFAPSLRRARETYAETLRFRLVVGGLRAGPSAAPLDESLRGYLAGAWREVERRSGQPFDHDFLATADFVYDTGPACRAVVAARSVAPDRVFDYNESLQDAFYHRAQDPTADATFADVAERVGLDRRAFEEALASSESERDMLADFQLAREMGVHGFPTVLMRRRSPDGFLAVARGFLPPDDLVRAVEARLP